MGIYGDGTHHNELDLLKVRQTRNKSTYLRIIKALFGYFFWHMFISSRYGQFPGNLSFKSSVSNGFDHLPTITATELNPP